MMDRSTRILVPIRYPITGQNAQTLAHAKEVAETYDGGQILVLHVNVIQNKDNTRESEIRRAVETILSETTFTTITRQGFLLEETILDEARTSDVDFIIVGANQAPRWQQLIRRWLPISLDIVRYLEQNTSPEVSIQVVE